MKNTIIWFLIFFGIDHTITTRDRNESSEPSQQQSQVTYAPTQPKAHYQRPAGARKKTQKNSSHAMADEPQKSRTEMEADMDKLISKLIDAVHAIPKQTKHNGAKVRDAAKKAKDAYDKLYHFKPRFQIPVARNEQIEKALDKLHDSMNFSMPWFATVSK